MSATDQLMTCLHTFFFALEVYNMITHFCVLFGVRMLPRKDLARLRIYFFVDTSSVFLTTLLFTRHYWWGWWLCIPQMMLHFYYVIFWEQRPAARKVISWSSLDWYSLNVSRIAPQVWDLVIGTAFDLFCHIILSIALFTTQTYFQTSIGLLIASLPCFLVLFNPKLAWSTPGYVPKWVQPRLKTLKNFYAN